MKRMIIRTLVLLCVISATACNQFLHKKPWRDYSKLQFNEQQWKAGDTIERGRMVSNMYDQIRGKTREDVIKMLGEPDGRVTEDGAEHIWYNTEHVGRKDLLKRVIRLNKEVRSQRPISSELGRSFFTGTSGPKGSDFSFAPT